jgi:hypothetical protein
MLNPESQLPNSEQGQIPRNSKIEKAVLMFVDWDFGFGLYRFGLRLTNSLPRKVNRHE